MKKHFCLCLIVMMTLISFSMGNSNSEPLSQENSSKIIISDITKQTIGNLNSADLQLSESINSSLTEVLFANINDYRPYLSTGRVIYCFAAQTTHNNERDTYFISPEGDDNASGNKQSPWKTPYISVQKLQPGDTLIFLDGEYIISEFDEIMIIPGGKENAWITLKGEEGKMPTIIGINDLYSSMILSNVGYIKIENLEITSKNGAPFRDAINAIDEPINNIVLK
ncbi:MAG: hypothetical protein ACOC5T_05635, partial [Elusimicrobiota bacterium]